MKRQLFSLVAFVVPALGFGSHALGVGACCNQVTDQCTQVADEAACKALGKDYAYRGDGTPCGTGPSETGPECANNTDDDGDGLVNDGCPADGAPEAGANCLNNTDNDSDTKVNDGCPADPICIPTVSEWGVVAMALLVLTAGTVVVLRRRQATA